MTVTLKRRAGLRGPGVISALLLTAALVSGCGSAGTTPAKFKTAVNAQCTSLKSDTAMATKLKAIEKSSASTATKVEEAIGLQSSFYNKLKAIKVPAGDSTADQLHDAAGAISAAIATIQSAAKSQNRTKLDSAAGTYKDNLAILERDIAKIGATACNS